jgi:hypothetical protein
MISTLVQIGREPTLRMFADWTDRIAAGEVPSSPQRPQGIERNVVITQWDWADPKAYLHDLVTTDRRNPTVNANGLIYGALELSADYLPVLDPVRHVASKVPLTVRDPNTKPTRPRCRAIAVLGQRSHLDQQSQRAQSDVRSQGEGLDHRDGASTREPRRVQEGIEPSVSTAVSAQQRQSPPRDV